MGRLAIGICLTLSLATFSFAADAQNACKGDPNKWQQVFDGKDLTGWKHVGPGHMTVEDGLIHTHAGMGLLYWTGGPISNCVVRVVFQMRDENDNSGVFVRIPLEPREQWMPVNYGYEVQIDNHPERGNAAGRRYALHRHALFTHQAARDGLESGAGVEHDGDHTGRPTHDRCVKRREGDGLQRRRSGARKEAQLRTGARPSSEPWLVWIAESQRQRHCVLQGSRDQATKEVKRRAL